MTRKSAFRGTMSFLAILLLMPLGHAFVILMKNHLSSQALFIGAFCLGFLGLIFAVSGNRLKSQAMQVLTGAFGAVLFWGAWVEFIFISYGESLQVPPLMQGGEVYTKPEYLMMPTSLPFAALAFVMYVFMARTRWGVILVIRKWLGINTEYDESRSYASIQAFIDLLLLIWWAYLILLVEFDPSLLGLHHPVTMISSTICLIAGLILLVRSLSAPSWVSALRQAIVTVCVLWTYIEVMIKLRLFTEVWVYPEKYILEMILLLVAFVVVLLLISYNGHKGLKKTAGEES